MNRVLLVLACILCLLPNIGKCNPYVFEYTENCNNAYHQYLALHFEEGRASIIKEIKTNPYNLMATFLSDYEDYITLIINSDPKDFEQRKGHLDTRLSLLEQGDHGSPWYRFCKAGLYLHWTVVYARLGEHFKAAVAFRKSYSLLKENNQRFPDFEYNMIFTGLEEAVVGSLPGNYKWLASIIGIKGSLKGGVNKLAKFNATHTDKQPLHVETELYYLYTKFYFLAKPKEAWELMNHSQTSDANKQVDNLLDLYFKVYLAIDFNKSDEAIRAIHEAEKVKNYYQYPFFQFQMGMAQLTNLDSSCIGYFTTYLAQTKNGFHVKDAWQKMAYFYYINGKLEKAVFCRSQAINHGTTELDVDKQALRFAENKDWPNSTLLRARLLLDGGYYQKAFQVLTTMAPDALKSQSDKAEYYYRLGRVYEQASEANKAIENFGTAMKTGHGRKEQFAARAALHKGMVYEQMGNKQLAIEIYNEAIDMPEHDFQNSIDQQAKAGINRIKDGL